MNIVSWLTVGWPRTVWRSVLGSDELIEPGHRFAAGHGYCVRPGGTPRDPELIQGFTAQPGNGFGLGAEEIAWVLVSAAPISQPSLPPGSAPPPRANGQPPCGRTQLLMC